MSENHVPWLKHYKLKIFLVATITVLFIEMTDMLNGKFDFSLMLLIVMILSMFVIPFIFVKRTEKLLDDYYDEDESNLTNKGFTYFFSGALISMALIIFMIFFARWLPIISFFELSSGTARSLGIVIFIFLIIITIVLKFWPLTILIALIGGQHLVYIFNEGREQISYTMISMGTLLVLFVVGVIVMSILIHRDKDELDE